MTTPIDDGGAWIDDQSRTPPTAPARLEGEAGVGKHRITEQARSAARKARDKAGDAFGQRKGEVAGQVTSVADALRTSTSQLRDSGHGRIAGYAESIADQAERAADYVRDADLDSIRRDLEDLARRQPMLVIGGALALGVIGARFLRSSGRHEERRGGFDAISQE